MAFPDLRKWVRRVNPAFPWPSLVQCFGLIALAVVVIDRIGSTRDGLNILWAANGLLLTYLLLVPRWLWPYYVLTGLLAMVTASALTGQPWNLNLFFNLLNTFEATLSAQLLRPRSAVLPGMTEPRYLARFIAYAVFVCPVLAAGIYALTSFLAHSPRPGALFTEWIASDALGMAVIPPTCLALFRCRHDTPVQGRALPGHILLAGLTIAAFAQHKVPLLFFLFPFLMLILLRHGFGRAAAAMLLVTCIGGYLTIHGHGPFAVLGQGSTILPRLLFQAFLASGLCLLYMTSMVMENLRSTKRELSKTVAFHEMVIANSSEMIVVRDFNGKRSYVSSSSRQILGWEPHELETLEGLELIHPEDRDALSNVLAGLHNQTESALLEYRVQTKSGSYAWLESSMRVMRDARTSVAIGILSIQRDITQRKESERQLREAYMALETLAITDSLTHLANRRHFDRFLTAEWRRALRAHQPVSILLLDVDYFKTYNDSYGHPRGDSCLRQIAEALLDVVTRPADLVARIGGEEFAVVLQDADASGACAVAEHILQSVRHKQIKHEMNPTGWVTLSIGCATCAPALGRDSRDLIEQADRALYRAKHTGRNRICS